MLMKLHVHFWSLRDKYKVKQHCQYIYANIYYNIKEQPNMRCSKKRTAATGPCKIEYLGSGFQGLDIEVISWTLKEQQIQSMSGSNQKQQTSKYNIKNINKRCAPRLQLFGNIQMPCQSKPEHHLCPESKKHEK